MKKIMLSIPTPCHENWDQMSPQDKGRFCAACQKTVVDFTDMSDRQIAEFFKKTKNVCGRFDNSQLGRELAIPPKRLPWIRHFIGLILPAFLFSLKASGQAGVKGKVAVCVRPVQGDTTVLPVIKSAEQKMLKGKVVDEHGLPIAGASVILEKTNIGTNTDDEGYFHLQNTNDDDVAIVVASVGFQPRTITVNARDTSVVPIVALPVQATGLVAMDYVGKKKKSSSVPLLQTSASESSFSKFSVFPNPASSHANITLEAVKIKEGNYQFAVLNSLGAVVQVNEVVFDKTIKRVMIDLKELPAGQYFVQLTHRKSGKVYTETILIN